jgi:hypothetical protein
MYQIVTVNPNTGQLLVLFKDTHTPISIDVPIENGKYLEGDELKHYILGFAPTHALIRAEQIKRGVENADSLLALDSRNPEQKYLDLSYGIRMKRTELLLASDWLVLPDTGFTPEAVARFKQYRQELRDIPQQDGFPENVIFPKVDGEWMNHITDIDNDEVSVMELFKLSAENPGCARVLVTYNTFKKRKHLSRLLYPLVQEKVVKIITNPSGFYEKLLFAEPSEVEIYQASSSFRVEDLSGDLSLQDSSTLANFMFHVTEMYPNEVGNLSDINHDASVNFVASGYVSNESDIVTGSPYNKQVHFAECPEQYKELLAKVLNGLGVSSTFFNISCIIYNERLYVKSIDHCAYPHYTLDSGLLTKEQCVEALRSVLTLTTI